MAVQCLTDIDCHTLCAGRGWEQAEGSGCQVVRLSLQIHFFFLLVLFNVLGEFCRNAAVVGWLGCGMFNFLQEVSFEVIIKLCLSKLQLKKPQRIS